MRRRNFIKLIAGSAISWPLVARAQQPTMPVIGFLSIGSQTTNDSRMASFEEGLREQGIVGGRNAAIESRYALTGDYDGLLALANELVRLPVAVLYASGSAGVARAARAATATIPIVFANGSDPVKVGLVASLNRPGGNATGMSFYTSALVPKRLELLREFVPQAKMIAFLVKPTNPVAEGDTKEFEDAARNVGQPFIKVKASNENEIETAFATMVREGADAVMVDVDAYFSSRRDQLAMLSAHYGTPANYNNREYVAAGGLMSYGPDLNDAVRQAGAYVGRILKGEKPANLPVMQPTKFELIINLKAAKALGLSVPPTLLATADEVIE